MKKIIALFMTLVLVFVVAACGKKDNTEELLQNAHDSLNAIIANPNAVTTGFSLPTELADDVTATWTSSNPGVVTIGKVTNGMARILVNRPNSSDGNQKVTLKASLKRTNNKDKVIEKEWEKEITVLAIQFAVKHTGTINDILTKADKEDWVRLNNVTVTGIVKDGFYIADGTGMLYVYTKSEPNVDVKVGAVLDIVAQYALYYSATQVQGTDDNPVIILVKDTEPHAVTVTKTTIKAINERQKPKDEEPLDVEYIELEGFVHVEGTGNYNTFLIPDLTSGFKKDNAVMFYYQGNKADVEKLAGKKIKINVFLHAYRTNDTVWTVNFAGKAADIQELVLTPEETIVAAKSVITGGVNKVYIDAKTDIKVPKNVLGATVTWTTTHPTSIDLATGKITLPPVQTEVTLTAVIKLGTTEETVEIKTTIGEPAEETIANVIKGEDNDYFKITGVVTGISANRTYTINDGTGDIAFYVSDAKNILKVGTTYTLIGTKSVRNGGNQISQATDAREDKAGTLPTPQVLTEAIIADAKEFINHQNKLVSIDLALVTKVDVDSYDNVTLTLKVGQSTINLKWDSRMKLVKADKDHINAIKENDVVNIVGAPLGWSNGGLLGYNAASQIVVQTATDAQKAQIAADILSIEEFYNEEATLPTTGVLGSTVTWTADPETALVDGKLVIPADGTINVVLTATVKVGEVEATVTFDVKLSNLTLTHNLDFASATTELDETKGVTASTSYSSALMDTSINNKVDNKAVILERLHANISTQANSGTGVTLRVSNSNANADTKNAILKTKTAVEKLKAVEVTISNWTTDASRLDTFVTAINLEVSTDGVTWAVVKDLKPEWDSTASANNTVFVEVPNESNAALYFRINVVAVSQVPTSYQVRLIVLNIKFYS